jgi:hypothetical protein
MIVNDEYFVVWATAGYERAQQMREGIFFIAGGDDDGNPGTIMAGMTRAR